MCVFVCTYIASPLNIKFLDAQGGYAYRVGNALGVGEQVYVIPSLLALLVQKYTY